MPRLLAGSFLVFVSAAAAALAAWDPQAFSKETTLEFLTVGPDEGPHWSTVWLVVIDSQVYIRLGSRAAERMTKNTTAPIVKVRIAGQEFDRVKAEAAPDMVAPVAKAMGDKYWSDVFVHHFNHPLTMRLTPE
jgi:hypothetical protein